MLYIAQATTSRWMTGSSGCGQHPRRAALGAGDTISGWGRGACKFFNVPPCSVDDENEGIEVGEGGGGGIIIMVGRSSWDLRVSQTPEK